MYGHIFKYELKKAIADRTLWILSAILLLFALLTIYNGSEWVKFQLANIDKIESGQKHKLKKHKKDIIAYHAKHDFIGVEAPHNASSIGTFTMHYMVKPPHPNALFTVGQSDLYPYYARFSAIDRGNMLINDEIVNPVHLLIGKLDYSFFVVYLLPLLIIAMTYDILASEKEQGTLMLLHLYQPRTLNFLLAKLLFRFVWLLSVLYLGVIAGILLFSPMPYGDYDTGTLAVIGFTSLYALFWFALCFLVNMLRKNSLFNGIVLTMCWLFIVFLLPTVLNSFMENKYPVPSRNEQIVKQREVKEGVDEEKLYDTFLNANPQYRSFTSDTVGNAIITKWYPPYLIAVARIDSIMDKEEEKFRMALKRQEAGLEYFRFISPSLMTSLIFSKISRNALRDFEQFNDHFKKEQQVWRAHVYDKIFKGQAFGTKDLDYQSNILTYRDTAFSARRICFPDMLWLLVLSAGIMGTSILLYKNNSRK